MMRSTLPAGNESDDLVRDSIVVREARDGYTIVRCPEAPNFWFANCLVLENEPSVHDYASWIELHAEAFGGVPVERRVVQWETNERA